MTRDAMCDACRPIVQLAGALMIVFGFIALIELCYIFALIHQRDEARSGWTACSLSEHRYAPGR